ncbi:MAG TPA: ImmA/IrrE family metallo-endopeptidase [Conexibacter sp.]
MTSVRRLVDAVAARTLRAHGFSGTMPVDVGALAYGLGIDAEEVEMAESGRLHPGPHRAKVYLNRREPLERRRFTLAHEASHWLLRGPLPADELARRVRGGRVSEEYVCDKLAGALLMPRAAVRERLGPRTRTLDAVRDLAREAIVSPAAALVRLRDVLDWRSTLVQWVLEGGRWTFAEEAGLLPGQQGMIRTLETTRAQLTSLAAVPGRTVQPLHVGYGTGEAWLLADVEVRAGRALALIMLPGAWDDQLPRMRAA